MIPRFYPLAFFLLWPASAFANAAAPRSPMGPREPKPLARPLSDDPMGVVIRRLPNGLTVYLSPNHEIPRVAAWISVRTGSENESPKNRGSAHYLEHMLFKGSRKLGTLDYAKEKPFLDRISRLYDLRARANDPHRRAAIDKRIDAANLADARYAVPNEIDALYAQMGFTGLNAFTDLESTIFVCEFPSNRVRAWAAVESERFAHPVFRLFPTELEAVYEEKNRSMDSAGSVFDRALKKALYPDSPYGHTVLGPIAALKNPSLSRMSAFFNRYYVPGNMALAISGDFDPDAMMEIVKKYFGSWRPRPVPPVLAAPPPMIKGETTVSVSYNSRRKVAVAWRTVPYLNPDADALTVMDMIMDNSVSGLINLDLVQSQKVAAAGSYPDFRNLAGSWVVWAVPKSGQSLAQAEGLLMAEVQKLKSGDFSADDVRAVIANFKEDRELGLESNGSRAQFMADSFISREPWRHGADWVKRLSRVKRQDVLRAAARYLGPDRIVVFRHEGKPVIPSIKKPDWTAVPINPNRRSSFAQAVLDLPAAPLAPRWLVEGRDYDRRAIASGTLYSAKNPFDDLFSLMFDFQKGWQDDRNLCAALKFLDLSGAGDVDAAGYQKKLFRLGTSVYYGCGRQESQVVISGIDRNLWPSLELVRAHFESPKVSSGALKAMIGVMMSDRADEKRDPGAIFDALGQYATRGPNSAVLDRLSNRELKRLSAAGLEASARALFLTGSRVGYVGNRSPGEIAQLLNDGLKRARPPRWRRVPLIKPKKSRVIFVPRGMVQSKVGLFAAAGVYDPARAAAGQLYSQYMGGDMGSVLFQQVREARSLAYSVWGGYGFAGHKGGENQIYGGLGCEADKTAQAAALLEGLFRNPILSVGSQERFEKAQATLVENYRDNPIRFRDVPAALMDWESLGFSSDPRPARFARLQNYSFDDFKKFAARFHDYPWTLYVLGDGRRVDLGALGTLGQVETKSIDSLFPY
ncbi:MAG: M16 family metallopeptidase [Elusimicrobiota bacterium]